MLTNRTGRWTVGAALLCVAVLVASWLLLISPRRSHAADLRGQALTTTAEAQQAQAKTALLKAQFADLPKQQAALAAITSQLPPRANVPALVSDLQIQAAAAGVSLNSIVPGTPTVLGMSSASSSSTTLAAAGSVVAIPVTVTATGDYFEDALFTKYLQTKLTRSFLLNTVATSSSASTAATTSTPAATSTATPVPAPTATAGTPAGADAQVELSLNGSVFVLLNSTSTLSQVAKDAKAATTASAG